MKTYLIIMHSNVDYIRHLLKDIDGNICTLVNELLEIYRSGDVRKLDLLLSVIHDETTFILSDVEVFQDKENEFLQNAAKLHSIFTIVLYLRNLISSNFNISKIEINKEIINKCVSEANLDCAMNIGLLIVEKFMNKEFNFINNLYDLVNSINVNPGVKPYQKGSWLILTYLKELIGYLLKFSKQC